MKTSGKTRSAHEISSKRRAAVRVKAKQQRSESSRQWLQRQLNDPYVAAAKEDGYRSRAAYKFIQIDEQFKIFRKGMRVVDLGAAPGGWSQVVAQRNGNKGKLVSLDLLPIEPIEHAEILQMDFLADDAPQKIKDLLKGEADLVLSDMAPSTTGHTNTDHIRVIALAEAAAHFALEILAPHGSFVCKFFQGGAEKELLELLRRNFERVKHAKPAASRAESSETFLVAAGFKKKTALGSGFAFAEGPLCRDARHREALADRLCLLT